MKYQLLVGLKGIRIHPQYGPVPASSKIAQSQEFLYSSYD
jgi:hypothetical protein